MTPQTISRFPLCLLLAALGPSATIADDFSDPAGSGAFHALMAGACAECQVLAREELEEARGGLLLSNGMQVSFGLQQKVLINGAVESSTTLNTSIAAGEAAALDLRNTASSLVQVGAGNQIAPSVIEGLRNSLGTIVQNSADQQLIQTQTVIDIVIRNVDFTSTSSALSDGVLNRLISDAVQ